MSYQSTSDLDRKIKFDEKAKAVDLELSSKPWQTPHTICKKKCADKDYRTTIKIKNSAEKNSETSYDL